MSKNILLSELEKELIRATSLYSEEHVDLIEDKGIYYGIFHSKHNSFGVTKNYPANNISNNEVITLLDKLDIGFCNN